MFLWVSNNWILLIAIAFLIVIGFLVGWLTWRRKQAELGDGSPFQARLGDGSPFRARLGDGSPFQARLVDRLHFENISATTIGDHAAIVVVQQDKPEWHEILQKEIDRLQIGRISFNPPDTMQVGVKERIETRISTDPDADLAASLKGRGIPKIEEIKISQQMAVRLSGEDFDITKLFNDETQLILPNQTTEWAWDVTPRKDGKKTLHLQVSLIIILPDGEKTKDYPVLDREITVQVNRVYTVKLFATTHWKWLVGLLLSAIGYILNFIFKWFKIS